MSSPPCLEVAVDVSAKVSDLIGLCCFKYCTKSLQPPLRSCLLYISLLALSLSVEFGLTAGCRADGDISFYELCMADEEGDIEWDLPPLGRTGQLSRIGFRYVALIEQSPPPPPDSPTESNDTSSTTSLLQQDRRNFSTITVCVCVRT